MATASLPSNSEQNTSHREQDLHLVPKDEILANFMHGTPAHAICGAVLEHIARGTGGGNADGKDRKLCELCGIVAATRDSEVQR